MRDEAWREAAAKADALVVAIIKKQGKMMKPRDLLAALDAKGLTESQARRHIIGALSRKAVVLGPKLEIALP